MIWQQSPNIKIIFSVGGQTYIYIAYNWTTTSENFTKMFEEMTELDNTEISRGDRTVRYTISEGDMDETNVSDDNVEAEPSTAPEITSPPIAENENHPAPR